MTEDEVHSADQVCWTLRPLRGRPGAVVCLLLLAPALAGVVFIESRNVAVTALALAFVGVAVSPAVMPTRYRLDSEGVQVVHLGRTVRRPWSDFRRLIVDPGVLVLSPFPRPGFLDTFRGQYLRFGRGQEAVREEALRFVLARIPGAARRPAPPTPPAAPPGEESRDEP
jgi:hypothetical protein